MRVLIFGASGGVGAHVRGAAASGLKVTAADLAQFMVAQLTDDGYLRQAPIVSN